MIVLVSVKWQRCWWHAFIDWLMEPIPFPGMTFEPRQSASQNRF
jgi:hypothetical protein